MAEIKVLVALAFLASTGVTLLVLGCSLPQYGNWWPMFVLVFYFLSPIPTLISRKFSEAVENSSALIEVCIFLTTAIIASAFGLPIILSHKGVTQWGACALVMSGNVVVFFTILLFFFYFTRRDDGFGYSSW